MVSPATLSLCCAADIRLIHFHRPFATDLVSQGSDHGTAQLVQNQKRCFIAFNAKLPLEL